MSMRLEEVAEIVARIIHRGQEYGRYPYTVHLSAVVDVLKKYETNPYVLAAGWLHDAAEDTFYTVPFIQRDFGLNVATLVDAVTGEGDNRKVRQAQILEKLKNARPEASAIKTADRIANVRFAINSENWGLVSMYAKEYYQFQGVVHDKIQKAMLQELQDIHRLAADSLQSIAKV